MPIFDGDYKDLYYHAEMQLKKERGRRKLAEDVADDLYGFVQNLAGLYKSDIAPFDDPLANSCWDEVVGDAGELIAKIGKEE